MIIFFCQYFIIRFPGSLRAGLDLLTSHALYSHDMTVMVDLSKSRRNLAFELLKILCLSYHNAYGHQTQQRTVRGSCP